MHTFTLQEWNSAQGAAGQTIVQDEMDWLDLAPFQDVIIYLDCRETSATPPTITFETSPAKDDSLFQTLATTSMASSSTPTVLRALMLGSNVPLARYLRWKMTSPSAWDATFCA